MSIRSSWRKHADLDLGGAIGWLGFNRFDRRSRTCSASGSQLERPARFTHSSKKVIQFLWSWADRIIWFNLLVVTGTPLISLYGIFTTAFNPATVTFCVAYYVFNMIGMYQ